MSEQFPFHNTFFASIPLRNPIIIASSGLTDSPEKVKALADAGAGAVVLKSLFEEQISQSAYQLGADSYSPEAQDFLDVYLSSHRTESYLTLIRQAKSACSIPVIASINCYKPDSWVSFASEIEQAGADALEVNILRLETDPNWLDNRNYELQFILLAQKLRKAISIPLIIKMSRQFSNPLGIANQLQGVGTNGIVLFSRPYQPDVDIEKLQLSGGDPYSSAAELGDTLRWTGFTSARLPTLSIAAATGIHTPEALIKTILVGASAAEICSAVYQKGNGIIGEMNRCLAAWMERHGFSSIADFKGMLNYKNAEDPSVFERLQFMKYNAARKNPT